MQALATNRYPRHIQRYADFWHVKSMYGTCLEIAYTIPDINMAASSSILAQMRWNRIHIHDTYAYASIYMNNVM